MAIVTMTHLALNAERPAGSAAGAGLESVSEPAAKLDQRVASALDQMVAFVPSEVIGIYIAGVGMIGPASARMRWSLLVLALLLIPLFIWLSDRIERRSDASLPPASSRLIWVGLFATAAFLTWSAALPGTPFLDWTANANRIGAFLAVVLAALMPKLAAALGLTPKP